MASDTVNVEKPRVWVFGKMFELVSVSFTVFHPRSDSLTQSSTVSGVFLSFGILCRSYFKRIRELICLGSEGRITT